MTRSDDRRAAIIGRLADHVLANGLSGASLRPLAKAAGLSDRMLLYYFRDKAEVIEATLDLVAARLTDVLATSAAKEPLPITPLTARLANVLLADELWPYMCVWLEIASLAAREAAFRALAERIGRGFLAWGTAQLDSTHPEHDAATLLVTIEGMVLLKSIGLEDVARQAISAASVRP